MSTESEDDIERIILEDEDGNELEGVVLSVAEIDGQDYALIAPAESYDDESNDTLELLIFLYSEDEVDGAALFSEVPDEASYEKAKAFFASLMSVEEGEE
jgi:uncharacterized protein YrzB (UPF0473 family)